MIGCLRYLQSQVAALLKRDHHQKCSKGVRRRDTCGSCCIILQLHARTAALNLKNRDAHGNCDWRRSARVCHDSEGVVVSLKSSNREYKLISKSQLAADTTSRSESEHGYRLHSDDSDHSHKEQGIRHV